VWTLDPEEATQVKPRITVLTLGVDDLEASLRFYRDGLGLPTQGIIGREFEYGAVAFFDLRDGLKLAVWPRSSIARDSGLPVRAPSATELTIGHNVNSKDEVDAVMEQASRAGARIVKAAQETFWGGYAGYFQDPDDHLWEVAWNPQLEVPE
jgi:hypothetical protein